ncbi:MAG: hypothetical protein U9Q82_04090 [Chloroflexota bacterium]|nr:hypothetical protein [Chloroflexota bacterium]
MRLYADAEIKTLGFSILSQHLGLVEAERFIALIQRENFDYTKWRQNIFAGLSGEEISRQAMKFHKQKLAEKNKR